MKPLKIKYRYRVGDEYREAFIHPSLVRFVSATSVSLGDDFGEVYIDEPTIAFVARWENSLT